MSKIPKVKSIPKLGSLTKTGRIRTPRMVRKTLRSQTKEIKKEVSKYKPGTNKAKTHTKERYKKAGIHSFPGRIKGSSKFDDGTIGRFVQSIKGMPGKKFIQKGVEMGIGAYFSGDK